MLFGSIFCTSRCFFLKSAFTFICTGQRGQTVALRAEPTLFSLLCDNIFNWHITWRASLWLSGKESVCQFRRHGFDPCVGRTPWRSKWQLIPVFLPGKSDGQRSPVSYSPWNQKRFLHDFETKQQSCEKITYKYGFLAAILKENTEMAGHLNNSFNE